MHDAGEHHEARMLSLRVVWIIDHGLDANFRPFLFVVQARREYSNSSKELEAKKTDIDAITNELKLKEKKL